MWNQLSMLEIYRVYCWYNFGNWSGRSWVQVDISSPHIVTWLPSPLIFKPKAMFFGPNKLFAPQNSERSVFNLMWNGKACKFIQFSRHFGGDREYFSGSACRQGEEEESLEENRELDCFLIPCMGSGTGRRGQHWKNVINFCNKGSASQDL